MARLQFCPKMNLFSIFEGHNGPEYRNKSESFPLFFPGQPLTDPTVRPLMKYFWKNG